LLVAVGAVTRVTVVLVVALVGLELERHIL
jgi:hypothetical protein